MSQDAINPFDNDALEFLVLVNDLKQYSLWPAFNEIPSGWLLVTGPASRDHCLDYVEQTWLDIVPTL